MYKVSKVLVRQTWPLRSEVSSPVSSKHAVYFLAFRSLHSSGLMLISLFSQDIGKAKGKIACLLPYPFAYQSSQHWLTREAGEALRDVCGARLGSVCLGDSQDGAGFQACCLSSLRLGKGKKWECRVPYSRTSA